MTNTGFEPERFIVKPEDMIVFVHIPGESFTFDGRAEVDPPMSPRNHAIVRAMLLDALATLGRSATPDPSSVPLLGPGVPPPVLPNYYGSLPPAF